MNDGSADDTRDELEKLRNDFGIFIINKKKNEGKGRAVRDGVAASRFDFVLFLDADLAIPIEELAKFMDEAESGTDMVIASRFVPGLKIIKPVLWYRKIMERTFRVIRMVIINNYQVKDTQCGFKLFQGKCARKVFPLLQHREVCVRRRDRIYCPKIEFQDQGTAHFPAKSRKVKYPHIQRFS